MVRDYRILFFSVSIGSIIFDLTTAGAPLLENTAFKFFSVQNALLFSQALLGVFVSIPPRLAPRQTHEGGRAPLGAAHSTGRAGGRLQAVCDSDTAGTREGHPFPILTCTTIWRPSQKDHKVKNTPFHSCPLGKRRPKNHMYF